MVVPGFFAMEFQVALTLTLYSVLVAPLAQSDPVPNGALANIQGEWRGKLTYKNFSQPDRMVTLPTVLYVAFSGPDEVVLHFKFDDGPGKTVYSYESMRFEFEKKELIWTSGVAKKETTVNRIVSNSKDSDTQRIVFERDTEKGKNRNTLEIAPKTLSLQKVEIDPAGAKVLRNRFEFTRVGG